MIRNKSGEKIFHQPVLVKEVLETFEKEFAHLKKAQIVDATLGFGGHAIEFLKRGIDVLGIEQDEETLDITRKKLSEACPASKVGNFGSYTLILGNFSNIYEITKVNGFLNCDAILYDLGVSSYQLTSNKRGFSFSNPQALLDMRMSKDLNVKASDLLNALDRTNLYKLFNSVVDGRTTGILVNRIIERRKLRPFVYVSDLLESLSFIKTQYKKAHPATKAFLALRMAVNSELENMEESFFQALSVLKPGGLIFAITFHSLEDKTVVHLFKKFELEGLVKIVNKKPILPSKSEIEENRRSRSSKLRIIKKI